VLIKNGVLKNSRGTEVGFGLAVESGDSIQSKVFARGLREVGEIKDHGDVKLGENGLPVTGATLLEQVH
jgi:hypothetical protein